MEKKRYKNSADLKFAMYASAVSLILTLIVLIGATFAWFSFSSVSEENTIKSLRLDFEVYNSYEDWEAGYAPLSDLSAVTLIDDNGEPFMKGSHGTKYIYVQNTGTQVLLLDIQMQIKKGEDLADAMKFRVTSGSIGAKAETEWLEMINALLTEEDGEDEFAAADFHSAVPAAHPLGQGRARDDPAGCTPDWPAHGCAARRSG